MGITNRFTVSGITCEACLKLIKMLVSDLKGVKNVEINLSGILKVIADRNIALNEIASALKGTEYRISS